MAVSLLGILRIHKTDIIRESGASGKSFSVIRAADAASGMNDDASFNAPSGALLSPAADESSGSFLLSSAPDFLSLGEIKDPGMVAGVALNQSGTVADVSQGVPAGDNEMAFHYSPRNF